MSREKKRSQPMSIRMEIGIAERLSDYCKRSGQSKTTAIERALVMYIDDYFAKQEKLEKMNNKQ